MFTNKVYIISFLCSLARQSCWPCCLLFALHSSWCRVPLTLLTSDLYLKMFTCCRSESLPEASRPWLSQRSRPACRIDLSLKSGSSLAPEQCSRWLPVVSLGDNCDHLNVITSWLPVDLNEQVDQCYCPSIIDSIQNLLKLLWLSILLWQTCAIALQPCTLRYMYRLRRITSTSSAWNTCCLLETANCKSLSFISCFNLGVLFIWKMSQLSMLKPKINFLSWALKSTFQPQQITNFPIPLCLR